LSADGTTDIKTTNALDSIDGGAGTDTLKIENTGGVNTITGTIKNIEKLELVGAGNVNNNVAINAATFSESITLSQTDDTAVAITGITAQTINLDQVDDATVLTATFGATQTTGAFAVTSAVGDVSIDADGAKLASISVSVDGTEASKTLAVDDANATADTVTAVSIAASGDSAVAVTGDEVVTLTVTGAGAVDLTGTTVDLKTLTATDNTGGVTYDNTGSATNSLTANLGAGGDTLTVVGAKVTSVSTGAGDDSVTVATSGFAATSVVDLGAGDDTLNLAVAPTAGATLKGGDGADTVATTYTIFNTTIGGFTSAQKALISGFETLEITNELANGSDVKVNTLAGLTNVILDSGVATTKSATVSKIGANSSVTLLGDLAVSDGALALTLTDDSGASDVISITANATITATSGDATDDADQAVTLTLDTSGIETVNFAGAYTLATDVATDGDDSAEYTLTMTNDDLVNLNISGDQKVVFASAATQVALKSVNAADATADVSIDVSLAATDGTAAAITVTGGAGDDTLTGSGNVDTIVGGAGDDTISGGAKGDSLTGGDGNDTFVFAAGDSSIGAGKFDTITDFNANTKADSDSAPTQANSDATKWTGDVLEFDSGDGSGGVVLDIFTNASDATTFLANNASAANGITAALDSTNNNLYVDNTGDGVADFYIKLTGVTTLTEAAFVVV